MPVAINRSVLYQELKNFDLSSVKKEARKIAEQETLKLREELIDDFENHPVTRELKDGIESANISQTLNGNGNLTTYIGFTPDANPTEPIKEILKTVNLNSKEEQIFKGDNLSFEFQVTAPSIEEVESVGYLPFEPGQSWIKGIENGISGFGAYIYGKMFPNSRSGRGLQSKKSFRQGAFISVRYISEIMTKFYLKANK
jgi:hypothetical protein